MHNIYAEKTVSVTELKRNFSTVLTLAEDAPVAVLNNNRPEAYLLSAAYYERILKSLPDAAQQERIRQERIQEESIWQERIRQERIRQENIQEERWRKMQEILGRLQKSKDQQNKKEK